MTARIAGSARSTAGRAPGPRAADSDPPGLELVPRRRIVRHDVPIRFRLHPGDRLLVEPGQMVAAGDPIVERLRDAVSTRVSAPPEATAGDRFRTGVGSTEAELLHPLGGGRWRAVAGTVREVVDTPVAGVVGAIRAGSSLELHTTGPAIVGTSALGGHARGRLELATDSPMADGRPGLDVGRAGTILVLGQRVDAELLTRARAMGVRGIVVAGMGGKERRDLAASERRQRAGLHGPPPFGVLVLDGALRRPIAAPVWAVLSALAGTEVALVADPPSLVADPPRQPLPLPAPDHVRVRYGPLAGAEGRFVGLAGARRFAAGVMLEAGFVQLGEQAPVALPLADLERFA